MPGRRVLVIGEALVDIVERTDGSQTSFVGGSPANVAVGLARLGQSVELLTSVGDDGYGERIIDHLQRAGVGVVDGSQHHGPSSTALAVLDEQGIATYTFDIAWDLDPIPPTHEPLAVHTGSIACVLGPGATRVREELNKLAPRATITFDPNVRADLMGERSNAREHVESIVRLSDIVKVSVEDLEWLCPGRAVDDVAAELLSMGPAIVFVTRGAEGSFGLSARTYAEFHTPEVTVVDTVGAGDAFMAGIIDAVAREGLLGVEAREELRSIEAGTLRRIGDYAANVARLVVTRAGAEPPYREEVLAAMGDQT